jgi:hypothetical protein
MQDGALSTIDGHEPLPGAETSAPQTYGAIDIEDGVA